MAKKDIENVVVYTESITSTTTIGGTNPTEDINILNQGLDAYATGKLTEMNTAYGEFQTIMDSLVPLGYVVISDIMPTYGTWIDLGEITEGQTISAYNAGEVHNGAMKQHKHLVASKSGYTNIADGGDGMSAFGTIYDGEGIQHTIAGGSTEGTITFDETNPFKSDERGTRTDGLNLVYGLGIGLGKHAWKRIA